MYGCGILRLLPWSSRCFPDDSFCALPIVASRTSEKESGRLIVTGQCEAFALHDEQLPGGHIVWQSMPRVVEASMFEMASTIKR